MQNALPEAAVERFRTDLERLIPSPAARLGVAVSGGPDSLALLLLCHAVAPDRTFAATVDHRLRPESAGEAESVRVICAGLGIPHATLSPESPIRGSIQAAARDARYELLKAWAAQEGLDVILTAHHADDQAETLLMRLNRGAGIAGLAGIRTANGQIIRPLLHWRRDELRSIVRDAGLVAADDPSNTDDRFDRARIRKAIADSDWLDPVAMARSAAALSACDEALTWTEARLWSERVRESGKILTLSDPRSLPPELQRRLVIRAIRALDPLRDIKGPDIQRLIDTLRHGGKSSIGSLVVRATPESWEFVPAPPRRKN